MSFVDKVDKIEKMEQQMWKSAGETIREKKKRVKRDLSPKNYKWGMLGMFMYFFGKLLGQMLTFCGQMIDGFVCEAHRTIDDPIFDDLEGNIFHRE